MNFGQSIGLLLITVGRSLRGTVEQISPPNIVPSGNLSYSSAVVSVNMQGLRIPFTVPPQVVFTHVQDTNSMDPVFDAENTVGLIIPVGAENHKIMCDGLRPGHVIVYQGPGTTIIHRIIAVEQDAKGQRYFRMEGDNNGGPDPYWVYDANVMYLCFGVIY